MRAADGTDIRVWGFVDYANVDCGVVPTPSDDQSRGAAAAPTWSFNLKAYEDDPPGQSFRVVVPEDAAAGDQESATQQGRRRAEPEDVPTCDLAAASK